MPPELLAKIFRYVCVLNLEPFDRFGRRRNVVKRVQLVSHVCAHWRQVAVTTPHLWTDVLPIKRHKTPTEAYCAGLKEWLGKSAPLPIRVHLECGDSIDAAAVFDALLTAAPRWDEAHLEVPSLSVLSDIPSDGLKQLRKLTLRSSDKSSAPLVAFSLAPSLVEVNLYTRHIGPLQSQLTHLTVAAAFPQECLDTLVRCQNLVTATLSMPAWPGRLDTSELKLVTLGNLESLKLKFTGVGSAAPFFACLALPALNRLTLTLNDVDWARPEFTQFQLRSPNIEILSIAWSDTLNSTDLMAILRHAPILSKLFLSFCSYAFDETVATALSSSHQSHAQLVPYLRSLSLGEGCYDLESDTLGALIAARWWTDEQLTTFPLPPQVARWSYISLGIDTSSKLLAQLAEYREQGLSLRLDFYD
ncbi:hypothetical protein C8R46DRAFT_1352801 [Mycena filopes]|nr:hypothetical protein C8R46DRAFT_1352801 [Mycena filopes]